MLAHGAEIDRDLGRMMRVIVHDRDPVHLAHQLEAPPGAVETAERSRRHLRRDPDRRRRRQRRQRVLAIVLTRHGQRQGRHHRAVAQDQIAVTIRHDPPVGPLRAPVGLDRDPGGGIDQGAQGDAAGIIGGEDDGAARPDLP